MLLFYANIARKIINNENVSISCGDGCHVNIVKGKLNNIKDVDRILFNTDKIFNNYIRQLCGYV